MNTSSELPSHNPAEEADDTMSYIVSVAGTVLGISYPVLAISTGVRAIFQLFFKAGVSDYLPPTLSAIAASCYLLATIGFFYRRAWAWRLSVGVLGFETFMTFIIGTLSFIYPEIIGGTVWRWYGIDYAFFPLIQPLLGLVWLFRSDTMKTYAKSNTPLNPRAFGESRKVPECTGI